VAVAGVLGALKATNTRLQDHTFLFQGAGEVRQQNVVFLLFLKCTVSKLCLLWIWFSSSTSFFESGSESGSIKLDFIKNKKFEACVRNKAAAGPFTAFLFSENTCVLSRNEFDHF
jgi:hypothetical protein